MHKKLGSLLVLTFAANAWSQPECKVPDQQLAHYQKANAEEDAKAAIKAGELYFVGVFGYALTAPGLSNEEMLCYSSQIPIKGIEGTTDYIECQSQLTIRQVGLAYAERFNKFIIAAAKNQGIRCDPNNSFKADPKPLRGSGRP